MDQRLDPETIQRVEGLLGHHFSDPTLLERALTHPSYVDDPACTCDYERLEFLGDAVLGLIVVDEIFDRYPDMPEGRMTKLKIAVVSGTTLSSVAAELGLAQLIRVGQSERGTGGRGMASALENSFEALVGALYLDGGLEVARLWVDRVLGDRIEPGTIEDLEHPKSRLQELAQASGLAPVYETVTISGPPHDRVFTARVTIGGEVAGEGSGRSKKQAEMLAAQAAITSLSVRKSGS